MRPILFHHPRMEADRKRRQRSAIAKANHGFDGNVIPRSFQVTQGEQPGAGEEWPRASVRRGRREALALAFLDLIPLHRFARRIFATRYRSPPNRRIGARIQGRYGKGYPARGPSRYGFQAGRHLLIAYERAERHEGETLIEGLPRSQLREFNCKLSFVPAGHRFYGWETPRVLTRVTYFYISICRIGCLIRGSENHSALPSARDFFFFNQAVWDTALKLKSEVGNSDPFKLPVCRGF